MRRDPYSLTGQLTLFHRVKAKDRSPQGYGESLGRQVNPRSLYLQQLKDRLRKQAVQNIGCGDARNGG